MTYLVHPYCLLHFLFPQVGAAWGLVLKAQGMQRVGNGQRRAGNYTLTCTFEGGDIAVTMFKTAVACNCLLNISARLLLDPPSRH
eukprot:scaffold150719_cov14-Tisochrysis_lutea.AAC.1